MNKDQSVSQTKTPNSLKELKVKLETLERELVQKSTDLLANQRAIKSLSPLKGEIETNLNKFDSDWPALQTSLQRVRQNTEHELKELKKELSPEATQKLDEAIKQLSKDDVECQNKCNKLEQLLHGPSSWDRICAEFEVSMAKSRFHEMQLPNITKRIAAAEARLKKASAVVTNSDEQRAEKYILIHLVNQDLNKSRIETDYITSVSEFKFPLDRQDYEERLVDAAQEYAAAQESLFAEKAVEEQAKTDFKQKKTKVLADRQNRVDRLIDLAKSPVAGSYR